MPNATLSVAFAGPLITVQDAGRPGNMRFGVSASGPMDRLAFDAANAALGNAAGQSAIEVSLGGVILQCREGDVTVAITGGDFVVAHDGSETRSWTVLTLGKGERLAVRAGRAGSWAYIAFAGTLEATEWLGSRATHSTSGFGGGAVHTGQSLIVSDATTREDRLGDIEPPDFLATGPIRVVTGPQDQHFADDTVAQLLSSTFKITDAYDRMGMRLNGPSLQLNGALSIPSEPIVRGSVQVSGDGVPTVLLADHQTTGGYPKIATVISSDIGRLVQSRAGDTVHFAAISSQQAITEARAFAGRTADYLTHIAVPRGTLEQRLMRENLIHGCIYD